MNVVRKEKIFTIDNIYALPEGQRADLLHVSPKYKTSNDYNGFILSNKKLY